MRPFLTCLLTLCSAVILQAQKKLSGTAQSSEYTYVYQISHKETRQLFKHGMDAFDENSMLHTLLDSFKTKAPRPDLKPGNYLLLHTREDKLQVKQLTAGDIACKVMSNYYDLQLHIHNSYGQAIPNAAVRIRNKKIGWDATSGLYRSSGARKNEMVEVLVEGVLYCFHLNNNRAKLNLISFLTSPFAKSTRKRSQLYRNRAGYFYGRTKYEAGYTGFMVFSKPKYKPKDTVKLKAWIMPSKGKPVNRPLLLRLTDRDFFIDTILTTIHPYRPGAYEYSFVLNDSLDLDLDEELLLTLEESSGKKFNLETYEGDLDEDEYAMQRPVLMRNTFKYEQYELSTINFTARTNRDLHNRNTPLALYVKATNENDMTVMDGRVSVLVIPDAYRASFHQPEVFLKDTLWTHEQAMDPVGETKIILPDSIFPAASFSYRIKAIFLNSNNEREEESLDIRYDYRQQIPELKQTNDSLLIRLVEKGRNTSGLVSLLGINERRDTILRKELRAPASIPIDPYISKYILTAAGDTTAFVPNSQLTGIQCNTLRTRDSVFIQIVNPAKLPGWYTVFEGNKMYKQGRIDSLFMAARTRNTNPWFVSIQYVAGDKPQTKEYRIPFNEKKLHVQLLQPEIIYPGQQTAIQVDVKDLSGQPVGDADITLFGYTSKFKNAQEPTITGREAKFRNRKIRNRFAVQEQAEQQTRAWLNWKKWSQRLGLDSIEYYRFLYPDSIYVVHEPAVDSVTQLAPFVVSDGSLLAIQMLYIDDQPYFFRGAEHWQQYSFELSPGIHSLKLRTYNRLVYADKIMVPKGMKTIVSINANRNSTHTRVEKMPDSMTSREQQYWDRYLILVENNNYKRQAYVKSDQYFLLNKSFSSTISNGNPKLIGPLRDIHAQFNLKGHYILPFEREGGYQYRFENGLIKMKQWPNNYKPYKTHFNTYLQPASLSDQAITGKMLDSLWTDYIDHRNATEDLFHYNYVYGQNAGKLVIQADTHAHGEKAFIKNLLLFKNGDPNFLRVYKGNARALGNLYQGNYRLLLLLKNDQYYLIDSITVRPGGTNFFNCGPVVAKGPDAMSRSIIDMINSRELASGDPEPVYSSDSIKTAFNDQYFKLPDNARTIAGQITANGVPLTGVSVLIKNTRIGTTTDANGRFSMKVPDQGMLRIVYIGYETQEISLDDKGYYEIRLTASSQALKEVVVVGYGIQKKQLLTGSVVTVTTQELSGTVPGILSMNGFSSVEDKTKPAFVNQGFDENPDQTIPGNTLRTNFRDEAYWFPSLRTNQEGKATVSVIFPDDITNWKTYAIATTDKRETGMSTRNVKSFKLLSATLHLPNFAVVGDEMQVLGKTMNYGFDSLQLKRNFLLDGKELANGIIDVKNSRVDTFRVTASGDSMKMSYTIQRKDGYFDGEERKLTVFPRGVTETMGLFAAMNKDSLINFHPLPGSAVTVHAETSALPVLLDEIEHVYNYEYSCNEQLASKLKALLLKKKVYGLMKKDFQQNKQIREIISQLNKSKASDNLWGWWKGNESTGWITLHVVEALLMAEEQKFNTELNKSLVRDYMAYSLERTPRKISTMLPVLRTLRRLDSRIFFKPWIDSLANNHIEKDLFETLSLFAFEQELEPKPVPDSLLAKRNSTVFGNLYWGEEGYRFWDNSIQNTLLMYKILKRAGHHEDLLQKIRLYFLEKRKDGHWRNTYESILILETILPDLLQDPSFNTPSTLVLHQGTVSHTVTAFPFTMKFNNREQIRIEKKGILPVYLTAYQQKWNPAPEKVDNNFAVTSFFLQKRDTVRLLKGGEPVMLQANVEVKADASYVMVEIPIPAGCSYDGKPQPWSNNEVHREYFLNKVSIFCTELKKGHYNFIVPLLPRYTGSYHLNPATASMMYFPVFFGREGMKKVTIR